MEKENSKSDRLGDEAPSLKDFIIVVVVAVVIIAFFWIAYHKFGWFH
jgi:hypothetical protein